jgi:hypothetical protein
MTADLFATFWLFTSQDWAMDKRAVSIFFFSFFFFHFFFFKAPTKPAKTAKADTARPTAGKKGAAPEPSVAGKSMRGAASGKKRAGNSEESDAIAGRGAMASEGPVKVLEFPQIMPPPPCLFSQAALSPAESGSKFPFEGWSLNQLEGLASELEHISRVVEDFEPTVQAELAKIEQLEQQPASSYPCVIEGGVAALPTTPASATKEKMGPSEEVGLSEADASNASVSVNAGGSGGAAGGPAAGASGGAGGANGAAANAAAGGVEDSYEDFDYGADDEDEDEYDYRSGGAGGGQSKKPLSRNTFWGWMDQYFVKLGPQHLQMLKETKLDGDPSFVIPKLGREDEYRQTDDKRIGDVTARLLAALVSDSEGARKSVKKKQPESDPKKAKTEETPNVVFSKELSNQVDEKIKQHLVALQLMQSKGLPPPEGREDDEICEAIRVLQAQLTQQIKANNAMKAELRPLVEKRIQLQAREEEEKKEWDAVLKKYEDLMATKRK